MINFAQKKKKEGEKKEGKKKSEISRLQSMFKQARPSENVPKRFRLLYKHATTIMQTTGASIQIPSDAEVFGTVKTIFVLQENIMALLENKMIGQSVISAYMM